MQQARVIEVPATLTDRIGFRQMDVATESYGRESYDIVFVSTMEQQILVDQHGPQFVQMHLAKVLGRLGRKWLCFACTS